MTWKATPPAIEIAAAWTAAACLGGAAGFAIFEVAPLGAGLAEACVAAVSVALAGVAIMARVDRHRGQSSLAVAPMEDYLFADDVLLLDQPLEDEALLLDEPIAAVNDPRVVHLFAGQAESMAGTASFVGPGEMAARIEHFLGRPRGDAASAGQTAAEDASAALHSALADIRRSLRQG